MICNLVSVNNVLLFLNTNFFHLVEQTKNLLWTGFTTMIKTTNQI